MVATVSEPAPAPLETLPDPEPETDQADQAAEPPCARGTYVGVAPDWTIGVGAEIITDREIWQAIKSGMHWHSDFVVTVTEGRPPTAVGLKAGALSRQLDAWEVALCRVRRGEAGRWIASLPPMGPTHHSRALRVARWAQTRFGARGEVS